MWVNPDAQQDREALFLNPFEAAADSLDVTTIKGEVRDIADIQKVFSELGRRGRQKGGGHPRRVLRQP